MVKDLNELNETKAISEYTAHEQSCIRGWLAKKGKERVEIKTKVEPELEYLKIVRVKRNNKIVAKATEVFRKMDS